MGHTISQAAGQLRPSAYVRGRGRLQLLKLPAPAAGAAFQRVVPGDYWERLIGVTFSYAAAAAAGVRIPVINYQDGDGFTFNQTPVPAVINGGETWAVYGDLSSTPGLQQGISQSAQGQQTAPAAGTTIASMTLSAGKWVVQWSILFEGTPAVAEVDNLQLVLGANVIAISSNADASEFVYIQLAQVIDVPAGGATLAMKNIGVGTAAVTYVANMTATFQSAMSIYPELPDYILKSGWQVQITAAGINAADQISQVAFLAERYPSSDIDRLELDPVAELLQLLRPGG
jgi:hypothetical protein